MDIDGESDEEEVGDLIHDEAREVSEAAAAAEEAATGGEEE